jgi:EamA domain-containing membrane protein RarD
VAALLDPAAGATVGLGSTNSTMDFSTAPATAIILASASSAYLTSTKALSVVALSTVALSAAPLSVAALSTVVLSAADYQS